MLDTLNISDRRQSPRYVIAMPIDIVLANGNTLTVNMRNISSSGLQMACDRWVTDEIEPRGIQSHTISHLRLKVIAALPVGKATQKMYVNCRIMSVQRMSQDEYMLNLAFVDFESGSEKALDDFLGQYQQNKTFVGAIA